MQITSAKKRQEGGEASLTNDRENIPGLDGVLSL